MKYCPKCARGYGDEIYYCLHDGSYLTDRDPEETLYGKRPFAAQEPTIDADAFANQQKRPSYSPMPKQRKRSRILDLIIFLGIGIAAALAVLGALGIVYKIANK